MPHRVLDEVRSGTEFAVWALIARHRNWSNPDGESWPSRRRLQRALGHLDPKTVSLATNALQRRGLLRKRHDHRRARVFYRVETAGKYVELDPRVLDLMADRHLSPEDVMWLARYQRTCGEGRWTADSVWEMAERHGASTSTVKRHRRNLLAAGLLQHEPRAGRSTLTRTLDPEQLNAALSRLDVGPMTPPLDPQLALDEGWPAPGPGPAPVPAPGLESAAAAGTAAALELGVPVAVIRVDHRAGVAALREAARTGRERRTSG